MKIDRVVFSLNNNKTYTSFWNIISEIYYKSFSVKPTLIFVGTEDEAKENNLSDKYGEIFIKKPVTKAIYNHNRDWTVPWSIFYISSMFQEEVCMTSGIDQIPLGDNFFNFIKQFEDDKYIIAFSDAYSPDSNYYPSSHHVSKGKNYKLIFDINENYEEEILKVFSKRSLFSEIHHDLWALDESYSSHILNQKMSNGDNKIIPVKEYFHKVWNPRRIDRYNEMQYDLNLIKNNFYTELHSCRPYDQYKEKINIILKQIYKNVDFDNFK